MVKSPSTEFRRMILNGKDLQTDFLLGGSGGGPMGARQKKPIDTDLVLLYTHSDPFLLTSASGGDKHTLLSTDDGALIDLAVSNTAPVRVSKFAEGRGGLEISTGGGGGPFMQMMAKNDEAAPKMKLTAERVDKLRVDESVGIIPPNQRSMELEQRCVYNVVRAEVSMGDWKRTVFIPFTDEAGQTPWQVDPIEIPNTKHTISFTLGKTMLKLPARITLKKFDLVPYAGGAAAMGSMMRDFRSTIEVENIETGDKLVDVAQMNSPVYYDDGKWLFFQAQWDPEGQRWTVLGVGNRPGVVIMTLGCVMIFGGLIYAFYIKPIIIRRMKQRALMNAKRPEPVAAA
jgi:hypothetical protein